MVMAAAHSEISAHASTTQLDKVACTFCTFEDVQVIELFGCDARRRFDECFECGLGRTPDAFGIWTVPERLHLESLK